MNPITRTKRGKIFTARLTNHTRRHLSTGLDGVGRINLFYFLCWRACVFRHLQVAEYHTRIACELSHFLRNVAYLLGFEDADARAVKSCHVSGYIHNARIRFGVLS